VRVITGALLGLALLGMTACGSRSVIGPKQTVSTTTIAVASTTPTAPASTPFSTADVPTPQEQGIPIVALGTSQEVTNQTEEARITLVRVVDPVTLFPASSSNFTKGGTHTIGLVFSVQNLKGDSILGIMQRHEPSLIFEVYGTNHIEYFGFSGASPGCLSYAPTTVVPPGTSFAGCEFAAIPQGVSIVQVVISLDYGGLGGTPAAWQVS
jgi:hypothetical protein